MVSGADTQETTAGAAPDKVPGARRLNNLVSELLNLSQPKVRSGLEWKFTNPRDGWVFLRSTANIKAGGKASDLAKA